MQVTFSSHERDRFLAAVGRLKVVYCYAMGLVKRKFEIQFLKAFSQSIF